MNELIGRDREFEGGINSGTNVYSQYINEFKGSFNIILFEDLYDDSYLDHFTANLKYLHEEGLNFVLYPNVIKGLQNFTEKYGSFDDMELSEGFEIERNIFTSFAIKIGEFLSKNKLKTNLILEAATGKTSYGKDYKDINININTNKIIGECNDGSIPVVLPFVRDNTTKLLSQVDAIDFVSDSAIMLGATKLIIPTTVGSPISDFSMLSITEAEKILENRELSYLCNKYLRTMIKFVKGNEKYARSHIIPISDNIVDEIGKVDGSNNSIMISSENYHDIKVEGDKYHSKYVKRSNSV